MTAARGTSKLPATASLTTVLAVATLISGLVALTTYPRIERSFLNGAAEQASATLSLTVEGLTGALKRYAPLPALVAERGDLKALLRDPNNAALRTDINERLRQTAFSVGASDVYLMDISGLTLAASNAHKPLSFVGRSFSFRPYFTQALDGGLGQFFALGTTSGERGYFYAAPVEDGTRTIGVVAVKFTVDSFEAAWREGPATVVVSDRQGVVFMSSREDWHFRALTPLSPEARADIEAARQYPLAQVTPLNAEITPLQNAAERWQIDNSDGAVLEFVAQSRAISEAGWDVTVLIPTGPARAQALQVMAIAMLLTLLIVLAIAVYQQRRARLLERMASQKAAQEQLEARVQQRTADLNHTNTLLQQEVVERRQTEQRLRQTQAELVQAGKLAALGQMSAALSHEFNQPLAAVKSYADNAKTFLDRGRADAARENVDRISGMTDRMAAISKHLRNFARRPQDDVDTVRLDAIVDDARSVMDVRIKAQQAVVEYTPPDIPVWVEGGHVRLQQVIVNLLSNALDAMAGQPDPRIAIALTGSTDTWVLELRDHGPGIAPDNIPALFDPFFTTKAPGAGLGLGLSISYNIVRDFGGRLEARNAEDGGAIFTLTLRRKAAPAATETAAE